MALIKCNECGKEISSKSKECPHCGNPMNSNSNNEVKIKSICGEGILGGGIFSKQIWSVELEDGRKFDFYAGATMTFEIEKPMLAKFSYSHKEFVDFESKIVPGKNYVMKLEPKMHLFGHPYLSEVTNIENVNPWD